MIKHLGRASVAVLVSLAALAAAGATSASAAAPEFEDRQIELEFSDTDACGEGADLNSVFDLDQRITTFFDDDGEVASTRIQNVLVLTYTRTDTGNTATQRIAETLTFDDGGAIISGNRSSVIVQGEGVVYKVAGHIVIDETGVVKRVGATEDQSVLDALCGSLA